MAREQADRHFSLLGPPPFCLPFILRSGATGCRPRILRNSSRNSCGERARGTCFQPQRNSPEPIDASQRLRVPLGSRIVDGKVGPFTTNNEHLGKSLQTPVNESAKHTGKDDQPCPNGLAAGTLILSEYTAYEPLPCFFATLATNFDLAESSSYNNPTQVDNVPREETK
jgi:hypothetical protein